MINVVAILVFLSQSPESSVEFEKQKIADTPYEACSVFDVNRDGNLDLVSGEYWFVGPTFETRHKICDIMPSGDYFDDFSNFPMDVNGDGYLDILTGGWFGQKVSWRENPQGRTVEWVTHDIATVGNVERTCFWDIDGDGEMDIAPNTPGNPQRIMRLERDSSGKGTAKFHAHTISQQKTGHGLGFGDVNGDGRGDLIVQSGWFEAPEKPFEEEWTFHAEFSVFNNGSVPIIVTDVNEDGRNDLIVGNGHDYGLAWWEQGDDGGKRTWTRHDIDMTRSQYHEIAFVDIDNDGEEELITGKRWHAHSGNDPGADDPVGLYYYDINGGAFDRTVIDSGSAETSSGTGIYLWVEDIDGNGWKDILAAGKEGLYLFRTRGQ